MGFILNFSFLENGVAVDVDLWFNKNNNKANNLTSQLKHCFLSSHKYKYDKSHNN